MLSLVRHFGDYEDAREPCGICDFCAPAGCVAQRYREATADGTATPPRACIAALRTGDGKSTGRLHAEVFADKSLDRRAFEQLLCDMARAGLLRLTDATFEKDGKRIDFRKAHLTPRGPRVGRLGGARDPRAGAGRKAPAQGRQKEGRGAREDQTRTEAARRKGSAGRRRWRRAETAGVAPRGGRASAVCRPSVL